MTRRKIIGILRKLSAFFAALPLFFSYMLAYFQPAPADKGEKLVIRGEFIVLAFSGLFSDGSTAFLERKLAEERPDLTVLCGDNILPQPLVSDLIFGGTMQIIDKYCEAFERERRRFTVVSGKYDTAGLFDESAQLKRFMRSDYFVGGVQASRGVAVIGEKKEFHGNFRIGLYGAEGAAFYIFILDLPHGAPSGIQLSWLAAADKPYIVFSYAMPGALPDGGCLGAFYSGGEDAPFCIKRSGVYENGEARNDYSAKKIVLRADGGLSWQHVV